MPRLPVPSSKAQLKDICRWLLLSTVGVMTKNVANDFLLNEGKNLHENYWNEIGNNIIK